MDDRTLFVNCMNTDMAAIRVRSNVPTDMAAIRVRFNLPTEVSAILVHYNWNIDVAECVSVGL